MLHLSQAAQAIGGQRVGEDVAFTGVTSDSRAVRAGDLFVALRGERFDGHAFIRQALDGGAAAVMIEDAAAAAVTCPALLVQDTRLGLGALAAHWRSRFSLPLVAITGSNGKTTVKEMLGGILRAACGDPERVLLTRGNLNNDIGLPLTLLGLRERHRYAVIEMGMNHPGEIAYLCGIAKPQVALVNNAHAAHLEGLQSVAQVARAKGELFEGLDPDAVALINGDDPSADLWREQAGGRRVIDFAVDRPAAVSATCSLQAYGSELEMRSAAGPIAVRLQVPGMHNVRNALAAAAAATALEVPPPAIAAGLAAFGGVPGRLQKRCGLHGATLIDDSYNANPDSVRAAIAVLAAAPGRKVMVLGDMGELGDGGADFHRQAGEAARQAGVDVLFALGELGRHAVPSFGKGGRHFERIQELLAEVENLLAPDVTLLVKGSRFMHMERVVKSFEVRS